MKIIGIIPARMASSRFPGKPLELIHGIPMIKRVYDNGIRVSEFDNLIVATDDIRIAEKCKELKMDYMMTPTDCSTGTDRMAYVSKKINADIYVNLQGDEPLIRPETINSFIDDIINCKGIDVYNSMTDCDEIESNNPNIVKVSTDLAGNLLYMSRYPIPYGMGDYKPHYYKELGLHAYTSKGLNKFSNNKQGYLEKSEKTKCGWHFE